MVALSSTAQYQQEANLMYAFNQHVAFWLVISTPGAFLAVCLWSFSRRLLRLADIHSSTIPDGTNPLRSFEHIGRRNEETLHGFNNTSHKLMQKR